MSLPDAKRRKTLSAAGCRVQIRGLTSDAGQQLNGKFATVVGQEASGRLSVDIDGGCRKALQLENLALARALLPGSRVKVHGLQSAAGQVLNGMSGYVTSKMDPASHRYQVELEGGVRALKRENLEALDEPLWGLQLLTDAKSLQGPRASQEDRHVQITDLHKAGISLKQAVDHLPRPSAMFAVCDGHMGATCSDYVAKHLHIKILSHFANEADLSSENVKAVLRGLFAELDDDFLSQHDCADGSTAVVALLLGADLYIANLGDSCGVLCNTQGAEVRLEFPDHKPGSVDEGKRIIAAGGQVIHAGGCARVAHADFQERSEQFEKTVASGAETAMSMPVAMAVSHAFGDRDFKNLFDGEKRVDLISCEAGVMHLQLVPGRHTAVVLVSDGVTDVMSLEEIGKKVVALDGQPKTASGAICNESLVRRSDDNVTALVAFFRWAKTTSQGD
eukprot:TRINITY_DN28383_c0_g1_i1.p1 TRINITY_DN28383_c0_g1~~TRINITY_DN28383_c0_g1_i1.p1  ORF type:complete len:448 (+),score=68.90 TRINITY_DN28383_c0_g1_i1:150-1493(+)